MRRAGNEYTGIYDTGGFFHRYSGPYPSGWRLPGIQSRPLELFKTEISPIHAVVYLEEASRKFSYMSGFDKIRSHVDDETYDLCICLDCGSEDRLGEFLPYLKSAKKSLCLDHHITNTRYAQVNLVADGASSACEVLYEQLRPEAIDQTVAECLYTGIVHDTGVFKFSSTSARRWRLLES